MTKDKWDSINIRVRCPEGSIYVNILENSPGDIYKIIITVGKSGSTIQSLCYAIADLVSLLFESGKGINEVISKLSGITTDKSNSIGPNGKYDARSVPEAVMVALMKYRATVPAVRYDRSPIRFKNRI